MKDMQTFLNSLPLITQETGKDKDQIYEMIQTSGFATFWGCLLAVRQANYVMLSNTPMGDSLGRYNAAVLQGQIKGIDQIGALLIQMFPSESEERNDG